MSHKNSDWSLKSTRYKSKPSEDEYKNSPSREIHPKVKFNADTVGWHNMKEEDVEGLYDDL